VTLEYRVIVRGMSLEEDGEDVDDSVALLPVPSKDEYVEVAVLLGPRAASMFSNTASLERALSANAARLTLSTSARLPSLRCARLVLSGNQYRKGDALSFDLLKGLATIGYPNPCSGSPRQRSA
jgi:hypothetical protein